MVEKKAEEIQRTYREVPTLLEASTSNPANEVNGFIKPAEDTRELLPNDYLREELENFPSMSEFQVVRHFTRLSNTNFSIDSNMYPLGSCTMKYNPRINETVAAMEGFAALHPSTPQKHAQGSLEVMYLLQEALLEITGLAACSLHPAAGAQGELVGVKMIHAYHQKRGDTKRKTILIPDSAHGTNPASAALSGLSVRKLATGPKGTVDMEELKKVMNDDIAALMLTVPNTLGIFEEDILEIAEIVHSRGGLLYCDGANLNALVGKVDIGKMGVDVMHINLHKTFSTPHGGGGPGAGPVAVSATLEPFLPIPIVKKVDGEFKLDFEHPDTVGSFRMYYGNFAMLVRALSYIYAFGKEHIQEISEVAVLKANYLKAKLREHYHLPYDTDSYHEVVFADKNQKVKGQDVTTLDIAKRLLDFGIHPPTIYFPLIVEGAIMIEPTETEPKVELDRFISAMVHIAEEARSNPEMAKNAPHKLGVKRFDETAAARKPRLTWNK